MRIAIFSDNFYPELSGISDSVRTLAKTLGARGHHVRFYAPYYSGKNYAAIGVPFRELDLGPNITVRRLFSIPFPMGTAQGRAVIPFGVNVRDVAAFGADIIHTQMFFGVGLEAMFASWALTRPLVGTQHTAVKEFLRYSPIKTKWFNDGFLNYVNWYYEHCDLATAPSRCVFDEMRALGFKNARTQVISNPVDTQTFRPLPARDALKKKFGFGPTTIIHAGRLSVERHPEVLMRALPIIKERVPGAMLAFAGNGTMENELRALARALDVEDSVKFLGFVDHTTLAEAYNASELFGITSTDDTQSLVMMQAMAAGLPVIGVDARGLPEYINDKNGFIVRPGDERAVAEKAIFLFENPKAARNLGAGARTYAEGFSEDAIADIWEEIYKKTIKDYNEEKHLQ
ncbi:MAG TPA: glycosyltransferase [Candidatus Paceibacterota bacterium]|nr:glycosyltransferase [Candidatus Paceibacterota bacterium]